MKLIIAGSRGLTDIAFVTSAIRLCPFLYQTTEVVCGGAKGVDTIGYEFADNLGLPVTVMRADWEKYGKKAGALRNIEMAEYADALCYIRHESTPGTAHMIKEMHKRNKPVWGVTIANQ